VASQAERLPPELRPEPLRAFEDTGSATRISRYFTAWSERSPRPLIVFLDEIDSLQDDTLLSVLRQLRAGYPERPAHFPASIILIGLRDVRASLFNIKARSLTLANFTREETAELYGQHAVETGKAFTSEAVDLAWELSRGQPRLVNALAAEAFNAIVLDRAVAIEPRHVERAKKLLVERHDTHLDSLIVRLREPQVRRVIAPILAGCLLPPDLLDDDLRYVKELGLVATGPRGLEVANPIYREVIAACLPVVLH
jgi:hypothetical protein